MDLNTPGLPQKVAKQISEDIDLYCQQAYGDGHRTHLGASLIGHSCKRYLWYIFRWVKHEKHSGRLLRLFNRGHREEERFIEWLVGIGCQVWAIDENGNQYRISAIHGHFGGSLDGIAKLPERYQIEEPVLLEFKTNGKSGFSSLVSKGMIVGKPQHFAQTSTYGNEYQFNYCLYLNICKDNDEIHVELVKLNHSIGEKMKEKAEEIIMSQEPPPQLSMQPTHWECKMCNFKDICHHGAFAEKNCRSCKNCHPAENAQWVCTVYQQVVNKDEMFSKALECPSYKSVTDKV